MTAISPACDGLLVEFAAANLQNNLRRPDLQRQLTALSASRSGAARGYGRSPPYRSAAHRTFHFFGFSGLRFFHSLLGFSSGLRAQLGFVPIFLCKVVLNLNLGRRVSIGPAVNFGIDQRQRHFGHAGGIAVARSGEDDVFHARAAQSLGRLLAEHPGDRVGNIRLAAAVRADDGGDAFAMELQFGAITERFESQNLQLLQFEQGHSLVPKTKYPTT